MDGTGDELVPGLAVFRWPDGSLFVAICVQQNKPSFQNSILVVSPHMKASVKQEQNNLFT